MLQTRSSTEAWSQVRVEFTKALALALLLWGVAEPVDAWDEPSGFRDIPWGSPPAVAKEKLPDLSCAGRCSGYLTIGQVRVFTMIEFETGGGMDAVSLSFPSSNFYEIKVAFVERYGEPTARRTSIVQTVWARSFRTKSLNGRARRSLSNLSNMARSSRTPGQRFRPSRVDARVLSATGKNSRRVKKISRLGPTSCIDRGGSSRSQHKDGLSSYGHRSALPDTEAPRGPNQSRLACDARCERFSGQR